MAMQTLPLGPAGEQLPGGPTQLAQELTRQGQEQTQNQMNQQDFMAGLAEKVALSKSRQKTESDLDRQLKEARIRKLQSEEGMTPWEKAKIGLLKSDYAVLANPSVSNSSKAYKDAAARADIIEKELLGSGLGYGQEDIQNFKKSWMGFGPEVKAEGTHKQYAAKPMDQNEINQVAQWRGMIKQGVKLKNGKPLDEDWIKQQVEKYGYAYQPPQ